MRFYRVRGKKYVWLPEEADESSAANEWGEDTSENEEELLEDAIFTLPPKPVKDVQTVSSRAIDIADRRDYDVNHYLQVLVSSYAARLRKAFSPQDFEQLFRSDGQSGLFDAPVEDIQPKLISCERPS